MLNFFLLNILVTNLTIVTLILWLVSLIDLYSNKNSNNYLKKEIYECGFYSINKNVFYININTIYLLFFVLLYEVELILIIPFLINFYYFSHYYQLLFTFIFFLILYTLFIDFEFNKVQWLF